MISKTFYNLDKSKQLKILYAIQKEVVKKGVDNAKVVNICQSANIPRSAFYRYFDSLHDGINALLDDIHNKQVSKAKHLLNKQNSLLDVCVEILNNVLENEEDYIILKYKRMKLKEKNHRNEIMNMNKDRQIIFEMLIRLVGSLAVAHYENEEPKEEIKKRFKQFITILKDHDI